MATPLKNRKLAWLDTETTGLDPSQHEVIEIGIVRSDGATFSRRIFPKHIETASPKALEINGYTAAEWAQTAKDAEQVVLELRVFLKNCLIIAQNAKFDQLFVEAMFKAVKEDMCGIDPRFLCLMALTAEHLIPCGIESLSLKNVCTFLGIEPENDRHEALAGALKCRDVYLTVVRAGVFKRLWWRWQAARRQRRAEWLRRCT